MAELQRQQKNLSRFFADMNEIYKANAADLQHAGLAKLHHARTVLRLVGQAHQPEKPVGYWDMCYAIELLAGLLADAEEVLAAMPVSENLPT